MGAKARHIWGSIAVLARAQVTREEDERTVARLGYSVQILAVCREGLTYSLCFKWEVMRLSLCWEEFFCTVLARGLEFPALLVPFLASFPWKHWSPGNNVYLYLFACPLPA